MKKLNRCVSAISNQSNPLPHWIFSNWPKQRNFLGHAYSRASKSVFDHCPAFGPGEILTFQDVVAIQREIREGRKPGKISGRFRRCLDALCLFFQERYAEAEELVREALEIFEVEGANRVQIREALSFLTSILERQGKSKEANDLHMARRNPGDKVAKVSESPTPKPPEGEPAIPQDIAPSFDKPDKSIGDNRKKRDFERKYDQLTNVISRFQTMLVESRNCDLAIKSNQPDMARICKTFEDRVKIEWDRNANVVKDLSKDKDFYIEYSSHFVLADQLMSDITEQLRYNTNYKYYLLRKYLK